MIIQCDHCNAKFRMDDAKLANGPVKVRCAKCKEVFVVDGEAVAEPVPPPVPPPAAAASPDFSDDTFGDSSDFNFDQAPQPASESSGGGAPAADEFDWKDTAVKSDTPAFPAEFDSSSFDAGDASSTAFQSPDAAADNEFDFGDVSLQSPPPEQAAPPPSADDFSIDFGEVSFDTPSAPVPAGTGASSDLAAGEFSFDATPTDTAAAVADNDDFLLSFNTDQATPQPSAPQPPADEPEHVNFGDFSFGEMPEEAKPVAASAAPERSSAAEAAGDAASLALPDDDEELVPTALTSRKKDGSRFPLFLILGAIVLIVALAGAGVYFFGGPKAFSKVGLGFLVDWYAEKRPEEGSVAIRNIAASYVVNTGSGELFVVRGEAVNNFKKPRASVQVKVSILGAGGTPLASKTAFCGNALSNEQLATLPLAKIDEVMNNQFGDSLANLGVKPGSAIPFVVVISAVPKEATDYSVQVAGSTVATQ